DVLSSITSLLQALFHVQCANHGQIGQIDLKTEITLRDIVEMKFAHVVHSRCFDSLSVSQEMKSRGIYEIVSASGEELAQHLPPVGAPPDLYVNIEFFRVHHQLSCGSRLTTKAG